MENFISNNLIASHLLLNITITVICQKIYCDVYIINQNSNIYFYILGGELMLIVYLNSKLIIYIIAIKKKSLAF